MLPSPVGVTEMLSTSLAGLSKKSVMPEILIVRPLLSISLTSYSREMNLPSVEPWSWFKVYVSPLMVILALLVAWMYSSPVMVMGMRSPLR